MIVAFLASFSLVTLRAFQQQNVTHLLYLPAALTSFLMASAEVGVILSGVNLGWDAVPALGLGGACGVTLAMYSHKRIFKIKR